MVRANELQEAHRYEESLALYDKLLRDRLCDVPAQSGRMAGRVSALLCLNRVDEALEAFQEARKLALVNALPGESPHLLDIGVRNGYRGVRWPRFGH